MEAAGFTISNYFTFAVVKFWVSFLALCSDLCRTVVEKKNGLLDRNQRPFETWGPETNLIDRLGLHLACENASFLSDRHSFALSAQKSLCQESIDQEPLLVCSNYC